MFFFWRNKDKPADPKTEALATWNELARIQGLGIKPTPSDLFLVFSRFAKKPFITDQERLIFEVRPDHVRLKRCFGSQGCLLIRMALPVSTNEIIDFPLNDQKAFFRAVRSNKSYQAIKKVPIKALSIVYES